MSRSRRYCWTLNNFTPDEETHLFGLNVKYLCYGREIAPSTGTPHLQGYMELNNAKTFKATKTFMGIPRIHIEIAKGNGLQNKTYCMKNNDFYEKGDLLYQGKRTDIENIKDLVVNENANMRTVIAHATSVQSVRMAEISLQYFEQPRNFMPEVYWYYGPAGTGKSWTARQEAEAYTEDIHYQSKSGRWWNGYDGHEAVIINDMRRNFMRFNEMLDFLDRYPFRVEAKGTMRQMLAKKIWITSPYHPTQMFNTTEQIEQLLRRIKVIKKFSTVYYNAPNINEREEVSSSSPELSQTQTVCLDTGEEDFSSSKNN